MILKNVGPDGSAKNCIIDDGKLKNKNNENNEIPWKTMKTMNVHKNALEIMKINLKSWKLKTSKNIVNELIYGPVML